jgi:hypothetical protein
MLLVDGDLVVANFGFFCRIGFLFFGSGHKNSRCNENSVGTELFEVDSDVAENFRLPSNDTLCFVFVFSIDTNSFSQRLV